MDKIKNRKILIVFALLMLLLVVVGATYAYFVAQKGTGGSANINVEAGTTDSLTFTKGNPITIDANSDNFKSGELNQVGDTTVSAHLVANNGNNTASETYNVYLNLVDNPFVYTKENNPELILQVIDPEGNQLETLEDTSIKYVSVEDVDEEENPLKGFDITTATGLIPIKLSEEISAEPSDDENNGKADETWQIKIILINRDYDQQVNTGKTFNAQAIIMHGTLPNVKVETANITNNSMKVVATIDNYEDTIDSVEFKINDETDNNWHEASNEDTNVYSYTFTDLTESNKYEVSTKISFNEEEIVKVIEESITPKKTLADACPNGGNLAECIISLYNKNSNYEDTKLYYHDGTIEEGDAGDFSYRYSGGDYELTDLAKQNYSSINDLIKLNCNGANRLTSSGYCSSNSQYTLNYKTELQTITTLKSAIDEAITDGYITNNNIKNYVCFGTNDCSSDKTNLYRIIGTFKVGNEYQVKLIKADIASKELLGESGTFTNSYRERINTYLGDSDEFPRYSYTTETKNNNWEDSKLNTENLNTFYLDKLGTWGDKIAMTEWQVGGIDKQQTAQTLYQHELGNLKAGKKYSAKIGLMYISDYYYSAPKEIWNETIFDEDVDANNGVYDRWLFLGDDAWLITPNTSDANLASRLSVNGAMLFYPINYGSYPVRPTFYLNSNVNYVSGTGTSDDPIIIK